MKCLKINNQWHCPELIDIDSIKTITTARNAAQTLIRYKTGGYAVSNVNFAQTESDLRKLGVEIE